MAENQEFILQHGMKAPFVYLDYNATTPVDKRVLEAMLPYFDVHYGNPASRSHGYGWIADEAVKKSRSQLADLLNVKPDEIIFTSGATESANLGIRGIFQNYQAKGKHIVALSTEHKAVLDTCSYLEKQGAEITKINVNREGQVNMDELENLIRKDTILVISMMANNETGIVHDINQISQIVHEKGSLLFCDGTQACGKIRVDIKEIGADLFCFSAHKMYGPKGCGALYIREGSPRVKLAPQITGGRHERGLRSGTLNVPGIVGFGKACEIAQNEFWSDSARLSKLRTKFEQAITDTGKAFVNGSVKNRLPNVTNLCFNGIKTSQLISCNGFPAVSQGSACSSASAEPSHVLKAMGLSDAQISSSLRFSLGKQTTDEEIDSCISIILKCISELS